MPHVTRRSLLLGGVGTLALLGLDSGSLGRVTERASATVLSRAISPAGTTLEQAANAAGAAGYRRLVAGPGYPLIVREELAAASARRDDTRIPLASFVQFTDLHIIDAQSPMRFEFMVEANRSAFRPHEALGTHGAAQLVERVNLLRTGPFTGRAFDCVVCTGDNSDNNETIELDWFLRVMNGGEIVADTGLPGVWESVQTTGDALYYNPESSARDRYKQAGFPRLDGYFERVVAPHTSAGLRTPWFSVFGNHDNSIGGTIPDAWMPLQQVYTGTTKFTGFTSPAANAAVASAFQKGRPNGLGPSPALDRRWQVAADERRAPFDLKDFVAAHLAGVGPGPVGHGFTAEAADTGDLYYRFTIAPGVTGIALDSTDQAGFTHGSLGDGQLRWLERTLRAGSRRYYDEHGDRIVHEADDQYFILFSHHTTRSMDNPLPDPRHPHEARHLGPEVVALVQRYPNVLAWVNGHTHTNAVTAHPGPTPEQAFWEITTASHIDFPQQARILEVCDNRDGTLSLFGTLIESAAPYLASYDDGSPAALASLYRELAANALPSDAGHEGSASDRNVELLLADPLA